MKRYEALNWAFSFLKEHDKLPNVAEWFLCEVLQVSRAELLATGRERIPEAELAKFQSYVKGHANGIPAQHLIGYEWFYGRKFQVTQDVLIPRPETEELVQGILRRSKALGTGPLNVGDVGTGSGAIAITLALEAPEFSVFATDISEQALKVAKQNAEKLGSKVEFFLGNLLEPFIQEQLKMDILVSNPPYIPESDLETLDATVKDHEPHLALFGGPDGYRFYREVIQQIPLLRFEKLLLGFEIGYNQGEGVSNLLKEAFGNQIQVEVCQDINGKDRMVYAWLEL